MVLNIDWRKWFDRMQPQTLQIATMLLYLNGFFALMSVVDKNDYLGYLRDRYWFGFAIGRSLGGAPGRPSRRAQRLATGHALAAPTLMC